MAPGAVHVDEVDFTGWLGWARCVAGARRQVLYSTCTCRGGGPPLSQDGRGCVDGAPKVLLAARLRRLEVGNSKRGSP